MLAPYIHILSGVLVLIPVPSFLTSGSLLAGALDVCVQGHPVVQCYCWTVTPGTINYDCSQKKLTFVPEGYSTEATSLTFTDNLIMTIPRGPLLNLMNLETLEFLNNDIGTIDDGAFDKLMKLRELHLGGNRLTSINENMFRHLPSLELIDLSSNAITTIQRYAFFTAPSLLTVKFKGNPLNCQCEERQLKIFLENVVQKSVFRNAVCSNLGKSDFHVLSLSDFPACTSGENLFPPARSRYCYSCSAVSSIKECAAMDQAQCIDSRAVCYTRLEFTNTLQVYGGCTDYNNCVNWELQNKGNCIRDKGYVSCYICHHNSLANKRDVIGLTKTFVMEALLTLEKEMTPGLADDSTVEYTGFTSNLDVQVYNFIYGQNGSMAVEFVGLTTNADNMIKAKFHITCNTVWFIRKVDTIDQVANALVFKYLQGVRASKVEISILDLSQRCPTLDHPDNGYVNTSTGRVAGDIAYYSCNQGYSLVGSEQRVCLEDSTWNNNPPTCNIAYCPEEVTSNADYGTFRWPRTVAGAATIVPCPFQLDIAGAQKTAARFCERLPNGDGSWVAENVRDCPKADENSRKLQSLSETTVTENNVESVSTETNTLTTTWQRLQAPEVTWSVDIVDGIVQTDGSGTSVAVIDNTLQIINNVLYVDTAVFKQSQENDQSSSKLVSTIDKFIEKIDVTSGNYEKVAPNVAAFVGATTAAEFSGLSISFQASEQQKLTNNKMSRKPSETDPPAGFSGIVVPKTVFSGLNSRQVTRVSKLSSSVLREPKVFQSIDQPVEKEITLETTNETVKAVRTINSNVIGTSVPGVTVRNLNQPVRIVFQHNREAVAPACVYWDDVGMTWKSDGCAVNTTNELYTVCHCDHLTNFALLMDVYGTGASLSEADKLALAIISYIGCGLSLIAVTLTLITYLMFKKLRRDNPSKILMNLCVAIGLVDLTFVVGMQGYTTGSEAGCKLVAMLLHYFLLAAIFWMAVEAFYMYLALVKVFDTYIARFQLKSSLFGWALPLVIVAITLGVNKTNNYGVQPGSICWLERIPFYAAFLAPVCIILVLNTISFTLVLRQIARRSSNKLTKTDKSSTMVRLRGAVSLIVLLGLTWLFGILAVDNYGLVFHYLFAIFNSLQGFFIFIFYCCLKKEAQQCWRRKLPCLKSVYEQTTASGTQKGSKSYERTTDNTESEVSFVPTPEDSKTDSTNLSQPSQTSNTTKKKNETQFRGNWQITHTRGMRKKEPTLLPRWRQRLQMASNGSA